MTAIGKVSLDGIVLNDFHNTFHVASGTGEADEDTAPATKAVTLDTSAANTVKLATDGDKILGRLEVIEDRVVEGIQVGTIARKGGILFYVSPHVETSPAEMPAVGDYLVGAIDDDGVAGFVRKATSGEISAGKDNWQVVEVAEDDSYVIAIDV